MRLDKPASAAAATEPRGRRPGFRHRLVVLIPLALSLALAAPAEAAPETIAGGGTGAGQVLTPRGTAVHQASGNLYVADYNFLGIETGDTARISKFDSDGTFLLAWGLGVADESDVLQTCGPEAVPPTSNCVTSPNAVNAAGPGAILPDAVAVDQASGAVYVVDRTKRRVTKFTASGQFLFMVGKEVNLGGGTPSTPGNICTAQHLANGDTCGVGGFGTGPNEFVNPRSLAVDSSGVVWVGDEDRLASFSSTGAAGSEVVLAGAGSTESLALDSAGNFFVKSASLEGIRKLEAGTGTLVETLDAAGQPLSVTLDEADNVYVGDATSPYRFKVYNSSGEQFLQFGAGQVLGQPRGNALAIGETAEKLYVASNDSSPSAMAVQAFSLPDPGPLVENQGTEDLLPTTATLTATINPEGNETTYRFEYGTSTSYGQNTPTQGLPGSGFDGEDVQTQLAGLLPETTYHFRVVATNHCNSSVPAEECTRDGEDQTFTTPPAVIIGNQWATGVSDNSAVLHGEFDPLGVEAEAWLEYGTDDDYGTTIPLANLGDGFGLVKRQALLTGLLPAITYHFRFVASDERGGVTYTVRGPDRTFTTQSDDLGFELADNRVWEMVSPPDKHGARLIGGGENHVQASADGNGLAYQSEAPTEVDPDGNRIPEPSMNLAGRDSNGSWHSLDITPPNDRSSKLAVGNGTEYKLFSSDLSEALVDPRSGTPLSSKASERTPYLRENTDPPAYTPLVTGKEPFANVPPGIKFGGGKATADVYLTGASPNFRHFALTSDVPLVEGTAVDTGSVYEWSNGQIKPVSVLPLGEGGEGGELVGSALVGSDRRSARGAVSEDGSRVFWSTGTPDNTTALYVRDTAAEKSGRLDIVQPLGDGTGTIRPVFQGASADGTVVFFTDSHRLTPGASSTGFDLYRCELPFGNVASGCAALTDISIPTGDESAEVEKVAPGLAADGESIYFVARGVLDEAPNVYQDRAVSGDPNLYLWEHGEGVRFIATLAEEDRTVWGAGKDLNGQAGQLGASASPNGRYLAFMSRRSLTGYDNRDAVTGEPAQEIYRYDALTGELECASCNPSGARPQAAITPGVESLVSPNNIWSGERVAAVLPQPIVLTTEGISLYRPRVVLDNGRVFFNAVDPLVSADSNGQWDVYQYEPTGVGDCLVSSSGASVSRAADGCVSLISSGTAEGEAAFFDASETGDDAFFYTSARLSVLDEDNDVDIYDARVNGVRAARPVFPECLGEACQPLAQPPNDATPASAGFNGPGNLRPAARKKCPKGKRRVKRQGKVRCVTRKKRQRPHRGRSGKRRAGGDRRVTR